VTLRKRSGQPRRANLTTLNSPDPKLHHTLIPDLRLAAKILPECEKTVFIRVFRIARGYHISFATLRGLAPLR
jgi:hypothetical protein